MSRVIRRGCRRFALRAIPSNVINILAVPEPRSAYFLLLVQEKVRKEKDPPVAAPHTNLTCAVPCAPREERARAQLAGGAKAAPLGLDTVSRNPALFPVVLGLLYGD